MVDLIARAGIGPGLPTGFFPRCPKCRYDLSGLKKRRCPECGTAFSLTDLIAAWEAKRNAGPGDADFLIGALLSLVAFVPSDVRDPMTVVWKAPLLAALWIVTLVWVRRRADELREPEDGHRLLWLWGPCVSTALGLSRTPLLGPVVASVMLAVAAVVTVVAWRRAPAKSSIIATISLATPAAVAVLFGGSLLLTGLAGREQGYHWSFADYPGWYWAGVPGRVRGIANRDAVRIGATMLAIAALTFTAIVSMWALLAGRKARASSRQKLRTQLFEGSRCTVRARDPRGGAKYGSESRR